jgi:hypothetical protein
LFVHLAAHTEEGAEAIRSAIECIEAFTDCFNDRDRDGMDARLHFPHVILSGETLIVWDKPDQHGDSFFEDLIATGWRRTTYRRKQVVLATSRQVHLLVEYSRDDAAGNSVSIHQNLWIVTCDAGRWGIKQRSH